MTHWFCYHGYEWKCWCPLFLGRPFLVTSRALIDVEDRKFVLRVGWEELVFKFLEAMKNSLEFGNALFSLDATNKVVSNCVQEFVKKDLLREHLDQVYENREVILVYTGSRWEFEGNRTSKLWKGVCRVEPRQRIKVKLHSSKAYSYTID